MALRTSAGAMVQDVAPDSPATRARRTAKTASKTDDDSQAGCALPAGRAARPQRRAAILERIFGERYREYCAQVPRWLPRWSLYREPDTLTLSPRYVRKAILDAMWFLWAFGIWEFFEALQTFGLLPTFFQN